jgi:hypothetical protein
MSSLVLTGDTSGQVTLAATAVAGSNTITVQAATGTMSVNTLGTVNSGGTNPFPSSGGPTSVTFGSLPSWIKRITVVFAGLSTSGTSPVRLQIGGGSVETTGYTSTGSVMGIGNAASTGGFDRYQTAAADITSGWYVLTLMGSNLWVCTAQYALSTASNPGWITGNKTTANALDRVVLTTVGGADTFDAGSVNILYEG